MGSRHGDEVAPPGRQGEGLGAVEDLLTAAAGYGEFRVGLLDRGRDDDGGPRRHIVGAMAHHHRQPQAAQVVEGIAADGVRPGDGGAPLGEELSEHAHAGAADADEMEGPAAQVGPLGCAHHLTS